MEPMLVIVILCPSKTGAWPLDGAILIIELDIDGLVQKRRNSIANTMELRLLHKTNDMRFLSKFLLL